MKRQFSFKVIAIFFGIFIGFLIAEIAFRAFHFAQNKNLSSIETGNRKAVIAPKTEKKLGQVIQLSPNPKIIYEFIPSSKYQFQNVLVEISKNGFRDKEYSIKKPENINRIIGIGDSFMFGWGVPESSSYLTILENKLNAHDSLNFEIINTAVPGYNTAMEVATLEEKIELTEVDLVIIHFVENDFDLPNFIRKKPDYLGIKKSFILMHFEDKNGFDKRLRNAPIDSKTQRYQSNPNQIPEEYRNLVGKNAYINTMQRLKNLSNNFGFEVLVLGHNPPPLIKEICQKLSFHFLDSQPFWNAFHQQNPTTKWQLSTNDPHPSEVGHGVISEALFSKIKALFFGKASSNLNTK